MTTLAPAATPVSLKPEVVGKALYIELTPILDEEGKPVSSRIWGGSSAIRQILVFPAGNTPEGREIPARVFSRQVSTHYPRSQWDWQGIEAKPSKAELRDLMAAQEKPSSYVNWTRPTPDELKEMPDEVRNQMFLNHLEEFIHDKVTENYSIYSAEKGGYEVSNKTTWQSSLVTAVEVTDKDYSDLESWKTPQAVLRRAIKARVAAGLPEKLV